MIRAFFILLFCLLILCDSASAGVSQYGKRKRAPEAPPTTESISEDGVMQTAVQSVMASVSPEQITAFAACLEKYVDPATANSVTIQTLGGAEELETKEGGYENAKSFLATPMGQTAVSNCNTHIEALLPKVQQQFQQDLSQKDQITVPAAQ